MPRALVRLLAAPALLALAACGGKEETVAPTTECERLAASARAGGPADESHANAEAVWRRLTGCLTEALERRDVAAAERLFAALLTHFEGRGHTGRHVLPRTAVAGAIVEEAVQLAREADDAEVAGTAVEVARRLLPHTASDELAARVEGIGRWVGLRRADDLPEGLAPHAGPRVVCYADDFLLGEPALLPVLARWAREGAAGGLRVGIVPVLRGHVREGIRRVPAPPDAERAAIEARSAQHGLSLEPEALGAEEAERRLGLGPVDAAVVVLDPGGRVVGRLQGPALDPRGLEAAVQRAASR